MEERPDSTNTPSARFVLPCDADRLGATIDFFKDQLGFRLDMIYPADSPALAVLSGGGTVLELRTGRENGAPGEIRLLYPDAPPSEEPLVAPNGTKVVMERANLPLVVPELAPSFLHHAPRGLELGRRTRGDAIPRSDS